MAKAKLSEVEEAAQLVYALLQPTPARLSPGLSKSAGAHIWLKHENELPTGAFKVRGGLVYLSKLLATGTVTGVCAATRGNHGLSVAFAAARHDLPAVIVVPNGNSPEKNSAIEALGARLIQVGDDYDESVRYAQQLAQDEGLHLVPSFHEDLVLGVATYALEFLNAVPDMQRIYVPVGLGSGICGVLRAKEALDHEVEIIGVVSDQFQTYPLSLEAGHPVVTHPGFSIADGLSVRTASREVLSELNRGVSRVIAVSDAAILGAMGMMMRELDQHVEGAGAAGLAGALSESNRHSPQDVIGVVISGGNVSSALVTQAMNQ